MFPLLPLKNASLLNETNKKKQVLNDEEQRQRYDQFGEAGIGRGGGGGGAGFDVSTNARTPSLLPLLFLSDLAKLSTP